MFKHIHLLWMYGKEYCNEKVKQTGLSLTEYLICTFLYGHENVSQDDIANSLLYDKTTVARALGNLELKQYVTRTLNKDNKRKNIIALTEQGEKSINGIRDLYDTWFEIISKDISPEDRKQFDTTLTKILNEAKKNYKKGLISNEK